jgi:hypothetical protein
MLTVAAAAVAAAGWTASYGISAAAMVRNLAGFTGLALLITGITATTIAGARSRHGGSS